MAGRPHIWPAIVAGVMLLIGMFPLPYVYFQLLRWIICGISIFLVYKTYKYKKVFVAVIFFVIAILFNPISIIHFEKNIWQLIDFICSAVFTTSIFLLREPKSVSVSDKSEESNSTHHVWSTKRKIIWLALPCVLVYLIVGLMAVAMERAFEVQEHLAKADVYFKQQQYTNAGKEFSAAIEIDPNNAYAYFSHGLAYDGGISSITIKLDEATANYAKSLELTHTNSKPALFYEGNFSQAIADFTKAIELAPSPLAYKWRAQNYEWEGNFKQAIADHTKIIELTPSDFDAYYDRGYDYIGIDNDQAIADFTKAIELAPNFAKAYYWRGRIYDYKGEKDKAIADLTQSIKLEPSQEAYYWRGRIYDYKGEKDKANADYNKAKELGYK